MKKHIFLIVALLFLVQGINAQKYFTRTGITEFKASVEAFEPVEAVNKSTSVVFKTDTGELAALLLMKAFHFEVALMQEHFNENYMDSDKHPKATFKGKIQDFDFENVSSNKEYILKGTLTVRGIKKEIETKVNIVKGENKLRIASKFSVTPQEFGIKIPSIVRKKIAEKININLHYELSKK